MKFLENRNTEYFCIILLYNGWIKMIHSYGDIFQMFNFLSFFFLFVFIYFIFFYEIFLVQRRCKRSLGKKAPSL